MSSEVPPCSELLSEDNLYDAELAPAPAMKIPVEEMQAAFRRRRQEAGDTRPAKKPRREAPVRPAPVPEKPTEATVEATEVAADVPVRGNVEETVPVAEGRGAGAPVVGGGEGDFPSAEEDCVGAEDTRPAGGPTVIVVDSPAAEEEPRGGATTEGEQATEEQREAETAVPAPEEEAGPAGEAGAEEREGAGVEADLDTPLGPSRPKAAVQKVRGRLPRPARALPGMDDAVRAERALVGTWDRRSQEELRSLSLDELLDVTDVGLLRAAAGTRALREAIAGADSALAQASERARKYKRRCEEIAQKYGRKLEEAKAKENNLGDRLIAVEIERDALEQKLKEEEAKSSIIFAQCEAAEEAAKAAEERAEAADGRAEAADGKVRMAIEALEGMVADNGKLNKLLREASDRASAFKIDASDATRRAEDAEARARDAEARVRDAEAEAAEAREEVRAIKARAAEAEAESRKKGAQDYAASAELRIEMTEAATDGFLKGFEACRGKVAAVYQLGGLDDLQPFEDEEGGDEADCDGDGGADGVAGGGPDGGSE